MIAADRISSEIAATMTSSTAEINKKPHNDHERRRRMTRAKTLDAKMRLRVSPAEKAILKQAAESAGLSLSAWIRSQLIPLAEAELAASGPRRV